MHWYSKCSTEALDPQNKQLLAMLLHDLNAAGVTIGLCSHDSLLIKSLLDQVYFLENETIVEHADFKKGACLCSGHIETFLSH